LPISKTSHYDVIVIGAGINGCTCSYFLHKAGLKVLLIDQDKIAAGGSGAAGAFIAPKISKAGPLKQIMEKAYLESMSFYNTFFPEYITTHPLLHISKDIKDSEELSWFKQHTIFPHTKEPNAYSEYAKLQNEAKEFDSIAFDSSGMVDARAMCYALVQDIDFLQKKVEALHREEGNWVIDTFSAKQIIMAIGAYPKIIDMPYVAMRGIWGHRIDVETSTQLSLLTHHHVSISPVKNGICAIGATHDVHFSPFDGNEYDYEKGRTELLEKASKTYMLDNINILHDYVGLRSGSNDYLPLLGPVVDAHKTIENHPRIIHGWPVPPSEYVYYPDLLLVNGSGGYGFVLAPYLAKRACEHVTKGIDIDKELLPERFFTRWVKRKNQS